MNISYTDTNTLSLTVRSDMSPKTSTDTNRLNTKRENHFKTTNRTQFFAHLCCYRRSLRANTSSSRIGSRRPPQHRRCRCGRARVATHKHVRSVMTLHEIIKVRAQAPRRVTRRQTTLRSRATQTPLHFHATRWAESARCNAAGNASASGARTQKKNRHTPQNPPHGATFALAAPVGKAVSHFECRAVVGAQQQASHVVRQVLLAMLDHLHHDERVELNAVDRHLRDARGRQPTKRRADSTKQTKT